jgi:hypothetical protein
VKQSEEGEQGAHGALLGFSYNGRRREIGRCMLMNGIRSTDEIRAFGNLMLRINSLNGFSEEFGITFALMVSENVH